MRAITPVVYAIPALLIGAVPAAPRGAVCSISPLPEMRRPRDQPFIGTALDTTVRAGPGAARVRAGASVHGQLVRVDRLTARADSALRRAVADAGGRVVVVPWGVGPMCEHLPRTLSAPWMAPGTHGLFFARLRDRAHWVAGVPTFDSDGPQVVPYPGAPNLRYQVRPRRLDGDSAESPLLDADEMLTVFDALPVVRDDRSAAMVAAADSVRSWMRANRSLARRSPAWDMVWTYLYKGEEARAAAIESPAPGTWRIAVTAGGGARVVFYARTASRPRANIPIEQLMRTTEPRADGFDLEARVARRVEEMPARLYETVGHVETDSARAARAALRLDGAPELDSADSTVWRGWMGVDDAARVLASDGPTRLAFAAASTAIGEMAKSGARDRAPGRLVRGRDGRVRFTQEIRQGGRLVLAIEGERISAVAFDTR